MRFFSRDCCSCRDGKNQLNAFIYFPVLSGAPSGSFRRSICSADLNRLRYSDLNEVKTRDFFGETSPQTFVEVWIECQTRSASIFGKTVVAQKFGE